MKMTRYVWLMLVGSLCSLAMVAQADIQGEVKLNNGAQQMYVHEKSVKRIAVGNPDIVGITMLTSKNIMLTGKQPGVTVVSLWESEKTANPAKQIKVNVVLDTTLDQQKLQFAKSIQLTPAGNQVAISGEVESLEEHSLSKTALDKNKQGTIDATVSSFDNQVQIDIKVVEVSRQNMMRAGFFLGKNRRNTTLAIGSPGNLSGVQSGDGGGFILDSASGFLPNTSAFNLVAGNAGRGLLGTLSILEANGFAYTLAEPSLTAISGQSATFLAGG
jgi:pilus assembly protein CpaC